MPCVMGREIFIAGSQTVSFVGMKPVIFSILLCFLAASCTTYGGDCPKQKAQLRLIGFSSNDVDSIVVTEREPGSNTQVGASNVFVARNYLSPGSSTDTILLPFDRQSESLDIDINFTRANRAVRISEIVYEPLQNDETKVLFFVSLKMDQCYTRIVSYKVDEKGFIPEDNFDNSAYLDVRK